MSELFEREWLNCLEAERFDVDDMWDLLASIESALDYNPSALGVPHANHAVNRLWVYNSPPLVRFPRVYVLYEIDEAQKTVWLWASRFP